MGSTTASKLSTMLIYHDAFTNDEMFSDSYTIEELADGCAVSVEGKSIKVGGESIQIEGFNPSAEDGGDDEGVDDPNVETKIDVVHHFRYTQTGFDKKGYQLWLKGFVKGTVLKDFKNFDFFMGESMDLDKGQVVLMNYKEDGMTPIFYYFKDGLKQVKQ